MLKSGDILIINTPNHLSGSDEYYEVTYRRKVIATLYDWISAYNDYLLNADISIAHPENYFSNFNHKGITEAIPAEWVAFALEFDIDY